MLAEFTPRDDRADEMTLTGRNGASTAFARLAEVMRANELDARARREYSTAAGCRARADAYDHAAAIAERLFTEQVATVLRGHLIVADLVEGMTENAVVAEARRGLVKRIAYELGVDLGEPIQ